MRLQTCLKIFEKRPLASPFVSVRPSVRMQQLGPHGMKFHGILYLIILRKSVEKIQVSLQSDNNGYFTLIPIYIFDNISLSY